MLVEPNSDLLDVKEKVDSLITDKIFYQLYRLFNSNSLTTISPVFSPIDISIKRKILFNVKKSKHR